MPYYRIGKQGRGGSQRMSFKNDKEFKSFCKKFDLIGYKGDKQPFTKKEIFNWKTKRRKRK